MLPLMQGMQAQGIHRGVEMGSPPHLHYYKQHRRFQQAALSLFCLYACSTRLLRRGTTLPFFVFLYSDSISGDSESESPPELAVSAASGHWHPAGGRHSILSVPK